MKIENLHIISYGKLEDFFIEFSDGLNIIYGPNEAGKTTILSFIFDMLYGGTLPGSKIARYTKEHESRKPWFGGSFEGSMDVFHKDGNYHIYRNFLKNNERLLIKDKNTGQNAKEIFKINQSRKVQVFDEKFFTISESNLRNSFIINSDEDKELAFGPDLADAMLGHLQTNIKGLSLKKIIENIDKLYLNNDRKERKRVLKKSIREKKEELRYKSKTIDYSSNLKDLEKISQEIEDLKKYLEDYRSKDDRNQLIKNPQYIDSLSYQNEKLLVEIEDLEENLEKIEKRLDIIDKIRRFAYIFLIFTLIISIYLKKYFLLFSIIIVITLDLYRRKCKRKIDLLVEELKLSYSNLDNIIEKINKYERDSLIEDSSLKEARENFESLKLKKERILERLRILDIDKERALVLEKELSNDELKLEELDFTQAMAEQAKNIINSLSQENTSKLSDELLDIASSNMSYITRAKYSKLFIDEDAKISLYDSEKNYYVKINDLSRGTLEQVYFSYKLALAASLDIEFPLLIDDGFIFYDDDRKERALNLIGEYSKRRQIIYFTSNSRDVDYLKRYCEENIIYI